MVTQEVGVVTLLCHLGDTSQVHTSVRAFEVSCLGFRLGSYQLPGGDGVRRKKGWLPDVLTPVSRVLGPISRGLSPSLLPSTAVTETRLGRCSLARDLIVL